MKIKLKALALFAALTMSAAAQAQSSGSFSCITNNSAASCNQAQNGLNWTFDGSIFSITNNSTGYVAEVYFDVNPGVTAVFAGGTGTNFTSGASPANLPGGNQPGVLFTSDLAYDSGSGNTNGINQGETASFLFTGAGVQDFASGLLDGGVHVRSLVGGQSEGLTTTVVSAVPEPETYALMLAGLGLVGAIARRRKAKQA
jgi:hypothetical protein